MDVTLWGGGKPVISTEIGSAFCKGGSADLPLFLHILTLLEPCLLESRIKWPEQTVWSLSTAVSAMAERLFIKLIKPMSGKTINKTIKC